MLEKISMLHIIDSLAMGGAERQAVELLLGIDRKKYDLCLLTFRTESPLRERLIDGGIRVIEIKMSKGFYSPGSLLAMFKLARLMKKMKVKIVQTYGFYSTVPGVIAAKIAGIPVIICCRGHMNDCLPPSKVAAEKFLWRFCDKIVPNAEAIKKDLIASGVPAKKLVVIHNGINFNDFEPVLNKQGSHKQDLVGMIANFRKEKDHKTFFEAAKIVLKTNRSVKFILIGSGNLMEELKRYAVALGIREDVIFLGNKYGQELTEALRSLSISVLTSESEGISNSILESMAAGIPVISTSVGGMSEAIEDGVSGYLIPPKRPDILAGKITYLLENKDIAAKMGKNGSDKIRKEFNNKLLVFRFEDLYERMAGYNPIHISEFTC